MMGKDCLPIVNELRKEDKRLKEEDVYVQNWFNFDDMDVDGTFLEICLYSQETKRLYLVQRYYCKDFDKFTDLVQMAVLIATVRKYTYVRICDYECCDDGVYSTYTKLAGGYVCH